MKTQAISPPEGAKEYALVGADIFDARVGKLKENLAVQVRGKRVVAVCSPADLPKDLRRIELNGHTVLPGFVDVHVHSEDWHAPLYLAKGITTVRDVACELETVLARRERWSADDVEAPRLICTGPAIDYAGNTWSAITRYVCSPEEAREAVDMLVAEGVDQIKTYAFMELPAYTAIVEQAHRHGKRVVSHLGKYVNARQAIEAGVDEIEHLSGVSEALWWERNEASESWDWIQLWAELDKSRMDTLIDLILKEGTWMAITRLVWLRLATAWDPRHLDHPQMQYVPDALRKFWQRFVPQQAESRSYPRNLPVPTRQDRSQMVASMSIFTTELIERGAKILIGTDAPMPYLAPGFSYHDEIWALLECGMDAATVLKAATYDGAQALEIDSFVGSVEAGKLADLVIVDGNPLNDMRDLEHISAVICNGRWFNPTSLLTRAAEYARNAPVVMERRFDSTY